MVKYYLDGMEISHFDANSEILKVFPGIRHIRKMTMYEWVEMKAMEGNERAIDLLSHLSRVEK